jgi:hypothetical protein
MGKPLPASEREQLRVGGQHLAHGVLKLAAGLDASLDLLNPLL